MIYNYAFVFSIFLLILFLINVYFFYSLNNQDIGFNSNIALKLEANTVGSSIHHEILERLNYLPQRYKSTHLGFPAVIHTLINYFNSSSDHSNLWPFVEQLNDKTSVFPIVNGAAGHIIEMMKKSKIVSVQNAPKGTQFKLLFTLENNNKLLFKPKRYEMNRVLNGPIYGGYDRYNSEIFGYYLAMTLNFTWVAPATARKVLVNKEILPVASPQLMETTVRNESGSICFYGKCLYCKINETACPNNKDELEGAVILYLDRKFKMFPHPWRRSYKNKKMEWELNDNFCKKLQSSLNPKRLLNLIDVSIFDFLIQNGDRHHYEVLDQKIILVDNGKGLGNPYVDEMDILAPLYQCCVININTWSHLEKLSGGSLTHTIKLLSSLHRDILAIEEHFKAVERRLLKIYSTIQYCIGKYGSAKVFRNNF